MKYLVVLGDGMADHKMEELGNKTPLEAVCKPNIDSLAKKGEMGLVQTVPAGFEPGSDVTNLAILGYDPQKYYTGRSPLEAVSIGISLKDTDLAARCNLVTLSEEEDYENKIMLDHSSGEISSEEAAILINYINENMGNELLKFYAGVSYRHCLIWDKGPLGLKCTPPHDILDRQITSYLPKGAECDMLIELQEKSYELLCNHPVNIERKARGLKPANSVWLWGEGRKPALSDFKEKYGLNPSVISAVDLIKGIGLCAGFASIDVPGATGTIHTNFEGKVDAVIKEFERGQDFVYAHFEAPDECGHQGDTENKIKSIELIDKKVVGPLYNYLNNNLKDTGEHFNILILPDHPTPLKLRTHTNEPVPYIIYRSNNEQNNQYNYTEENGNKTGIFISEGYKLLDELLFGSLKRSKK